MDDLLRWMRLPENATWKRLGIMNIGGAAFFFFFFIFLVFCCLQIMEIGLLLFMVCQRSDQGLVMEHCFHDFLLLCVMEMTLS
jgi:hypothetical protein